MTFRAAGGDPHASSSIIPAFLCLVLFMTVPVTTRADVVILPSSKDNTIYDNSPAISNGVGDHMFAGATNHGDRRRALAAFDIAGHIPPGSTIQSVSLQLWVTRAAGGVSTTSLHRALVDWGESYSNAVGEEGNGANASEGDATWNFSFYPTISWPAGGSFSASASASTSVGGLGPHSWTSTGMRDDVQGWLDAPTTNFGWIILGSEGGSGTAKRFDTRESPDVERRPVLTIDYTPSGVVAGACCLTDDCIILTPADCANQGGTYQGNGTTCTSDPCLGVPMTIVIEPSRDNTLYEDGTGSISNGAGEYFFAGQMADFRKRRAVLAFDIGAHIPPGAVVTNASLTLRKTFGGSAAHDASLHRSLVNWGEGSSDAPDDEDEGTAAMAGDATWLHSSFSTNFWSAPGGAGDFDPDPSATTFVAFEDFYTWSDLGMIQDIQYWADNPSLNFGWFLIGKEIGSAITRKRYVSRESADVQYRPKLQITFSVPPNPPDFSLPDVPVPPENPITEAKRVLGKILFWEEQLSSDDTIACGTCHRPADGGIDPRLGIHPGFDLTFGNDDDIFGSPGVRRMDSDGNYIPDPVFGDDVQVTGRNSQNYFGGIWGPHGFWDGRAEGTFLDPMNPDSVVVQTGASLENQALIPILSDVEMAKEARDWDDVTQKLAAVVPMALASDVPADMLNALAADPTYPDLFEEAFGDPGIDPVRIGFAIATYERTLVPDQTPWDLFIAGDTQALTPSQINGLNFVQDEGKCGGCHGPPLFTSDTFRNIGLRPPMEDPGREGVTEDPNDRGRFKVPTLRNVGLHDRLMHTGHIDDVADALNFYSMNGHVHFTENQDSRIEGGIEMTAQQKVEIEDFLVNGLTDPRVAGETFPFDRPTLAIENPADVGTLSQSVLPTTAQPNPFRQEVELRFVLESSSDVEITIYSASGQLMVRRRVAGEPGENRFVWNGRTIHGRSAPQGVYYARLRSGEATATGRLIRVE